MEIIRREILYGGVVLSTLRQEVEKKDPFCLKPQKSKEVEGHFEGTQ